jgi:hypothetical protein
MSEHPLGEPNKPVQDAVLLKELICPKAITDEPCIRSKLIAIGRALGRHAACEDAMREERAEMEGNRPAASSDSHGVT